MVNDDHPDESGKDNVNQTYSGKQDPTGATGGADGDSPLLNRRSVLKTGATAAAALASAVNAVGPITAEREVSSGEEYETWTIRGQEVYDLSDGEVLENVLVDQTADGASLTIRSQNKSGWEVRNIGFMGSGIADDHGHQLQVSAPEGGYGQIENVWASGKERDDQDSTELGGIFIRSAHAGHIDIRHTYIEGFGNNAVYASGVGKDGHGEGQVVIENAYHRDNTVSQFRIGSPGSVVRNCIGVINDPDGKRGVYPGTDNRNARGIWGKHFRDQQFENCAFYVSPDDINPDGAFEARYIQDRSNGEKAVVEASECDVNEDAPTLTGTTSNAEVNFTNLGESPTVDVIQDGGVPTSPKMAARGERETPPSLPGESEDITSLSYEEDAIAVREGHYDTDDAAGVAFSVTNTATQELTVTHVTVTPLDSTITELHDESDDVGQWVSEVHVDADRQDGVCDVPGSAALPFTFDMASDGWDDDADEVAIMSADSSASVALSRFEDDGTPIEMVGKDVDIEVEYELDDGTTSTDLFTVTPEAATEEPTVDGLSVSEVETDNADAEFDADWTVSDADGNLDTVDLTLVDDTDNETDDTATISVSGDTTSDTTRLVAANDDGSDNEYTVELVVTDTNGATDSGTTTVSEIEDAISYGDDAIAVQEAHYDTDDAAGVAFSVTNTATQELTVTHVTVTPYDSTITELHDESDEVGRWVSEVQIAADRQDGVCDVPGSAALPNTFDMANDGWDDSADEVAVMSADSSASVALSRFEADGTPIEMVGKDVDIEVGYELEDGTTSTDLFTVTPEAATEELDRTLTFDGTDTGQTDYEVAVSGEIEDDPDKGSFDDDDSIEGSIATGSVDGDIDGYRFSGEVVGIEVDGDAAILVDGEAVEPDSLILPNYIVFDADSSQTETTYDVEVSGDFVNDPLLGPLEDSDGLDGSTAAGTVTGDDRDGFRFSGDLVSLRLDGEANVTFEDTDG